MTKEEAIMVLKNEQPHCGKKALFPEEKKYEAYDVAIKALEQEPCEDCVRRREVFEQINCWIGDGEYRYTNATDYLNKRIKALPPVTPKQEPKMGHWIGDGNYICSCCKCNPLDFLEPCGLDGGSYMDTPMKYCPNCGAKMIEPQESEEKK